MLAIGSVVFVWKGWAYLPLSLAGLFGITAHWGTVFKGDKFMHYFSVYGLRFGLWQPLGTWREFAVLSEHKISGTGGFMSSMNVRWQQYSLTLLRNGHREKRVVAVASHLDEARAMAKELTKHTPLTWVNYAPYISAATRARKRKHR